WQDNLSRWEGMIAAIEQATAPGSELHQHTHLSLLRFGHDPFPNDAGSTIEGETSGIVDGQKIDLFWDDADEQYSSCVGPSIASKLDTVPAPMNGSTIGIATWTKGALDRAAVEIATTKADHPADQQAPARPYVILLFTDGAWTSADGGGQMSPASENPALTAADLHGRQGIRTYVITIAASDQAEAAADELAAAGGTNSAFVADTPAQLDQALDTVVSNIMNSHVATQCAACP
ncbi:MAG TPA: hypothetical protein VK034_06660, partial [Enhygromyxa sp.]|nr:hypothetical protein [Enhygromyxa sp.]